MDVMWDEAQKGWRDPKLMERFAALIPFFSTTEAPDFSCLSLHALAGSLQETDQQLCKEQPQILNLYSFSTAL